MTLWLAARETISCDRAGRAPVEDKAIDELIIDIDTGTPEWAGWDS